MARKEAGGRSSQQNDFLMPQTPVGNAPVDVGSGRNWEDGAATVSFVLPEGSYPATSYTVTATAAGKTTRTATGSASPLTVVGLSASTTYAFTVKASNANGTSAESVSVSIPITTVPDAPPKPSVSTQVNQDNLSWSIPSNGGKGITNYQWESNDGKGGTTTSTSVAVAQEGSTAQAYRVRAYNANGWGAWSPWSDTITTTPPFFPPFFPFFPFFPHFPPFFPWFPWFPHFPPWFPFFPWFPHFPPRFPYFPPYFRAGCIEADTLIRTPSGLVAAKDIKVGDKVLTYNIDEKEPTTDAGELFLWDSLSLTVSNKEPIETEVVRVIEKGDSAIIYFNENTDVKYSITQPVFCKSDGEYKIRTTGSLEIGDIIIKITESGETVEEEITDITIEEELGTVYQIDCEPTQWFIAGDYFVHNK